LTSNDITLAIVQKIGPILEYSRLGLEDEADAEVSAAETVDGAFGGGVPALAARGKRDWIDGWSVLPFTNLFNLLGSLLFEAG
jgi:hypothetical protein